jgi:hypothetical protein
MKKDKSRQYEQKQKPEPEQNQRGGRREIPGLPLFGDIVKLGKDLKLSIYERDFLMILRNSMNQQNRSCWKSLRTLAEDIRCSLRTAVEARKSLENKGLIQVGKREGWHGRFALNEYRIIFPWTLPCAPGLHGQETSPYARHANGPHATPAQGNMCAPCKRTYAPRAHKSVNRKELNKVNQSSENRTDDDFFLTEETE